MKYFYLVQHTINKFKGILTTNISSYAERAKKVSAIVHDQKESPLERAIYWIEYVIRHRGAPHLRIASRKLSLYQRCLFDVMLLIFVATLLLCYATNFLCRWVHLTLLFQKQGKRLKGSHKKMD
jgi:glucuronosyltransferase